MGAWALALAGVVAVACGVWVYRRFTTTAPDSVEVRPRELVQTIVSSGQVMPPAEVRLDSLLTSTVQQILQREGATVHAGDVLLLLDDSEIRAARAQATAALAQARAGKSSLKVTTLPQANAALAQIRSSLAESLSDRERQRRLFAAGAITPSALDKAESAAQIAASQEQAALLQVQAASRGGSATLTASAAIALAESQLASVAVNEERARIVAPMDGVITERFVEVGEVVRPGSPLLVLAARGRTRIVLEPDERNLALLALGQKAAVSAEAFPESSFEATLGYIAPAVNGERGTIEVRLDVAHPPAYLCPNMTVSVELSIETRSHSLALPLASVQDLGSSRPWVGVLGSRGRIERRDVHLGLRGDTLVEVSSGLASGERVVFEPPAEPKTREPPVGE
jgi:HlyD family secretion protein